jgi:hypothetical protein
VRALPLLLGQMAEVPRDIRAPNGEFEVPVASGRAFSVHVQNSAVDAWSREGWLLQDDLQTGEGCCAWHTRLWGCCGCYCKRCRREEFGLITATAHLNWNCICYCRCRLVVHANCL